MKKPKDFDCVEMMHACQEAVKKRLEGMTRQETLEHYRRRSEAWKRERETRRAGSKSGG